MSFRNLNDEMFNLYICDLCEKSFHLKINYKNHMKIHYKKSYYCSYQNCYKRFNNKISRENHERIFHLDIKENRYFQNVINRVMEDVNLNFNNYSKIGVNILNKLKI